MSSDDEESISAVEALAWAIERRNDHRCCMVRCQSKNCDNAALDGELVCDTHLDGAIGTVVLDELWDEYQAFLDEEGVAFPPLVVNTKRDLVKLRTVVAVPKVATQVAATKLIRRVIPGVVTTAPRAPPTATKVLKDGTPAAPRCQGVNKKTGLPCGNVTRNKNGICHAH